VPVSQLYIHTRRRKTPPIPTALVTLVMLSQWLSLSRYGLAGRRAVPALFSVPGASSQRSRWTKAKIKRTARYKRRQELDAAGIALPNPPYYFPRDLPVVNAVDRGGIQAEIAEHDARIAAQLQAQLVTQKTPLRFNMTGLRMSDRVRQLFDLHNGSQREVVQAQKQQGMELFQLRQGDTGSSAVQVVALTTRIQQLQTHMAQHKKDKHSKRGLDALYVRRRKLLDYMERREFESYRRVVKTLGLTR
jgi:small subunit ribosomal protein S15